MFSVPRRIEKYPRETNHYVLLNASEFLRNTFLKSKCFVLIICLLYMKYYNASKKQNRGSANGIHPKHGFSSIMGSVDGADGLHLLGLGFCCNECVFVYVPCTGLAYHPRCTYAMCPTLPRTDSRPHCNRDQGKSSSMDGWLASPYAIG